MVSMAACPGALTSSMAQATSFGAAALGRFDPGENVVWRPRDLRAGLGAVVQRRSNLGRDCWAITIVVSESELERSHPRASSAQVPASSFSPSALPAPCLQSTTSVDGRGMQLLSYRLYGLEQRLAHWESDRLHQRVDRLSERLDLSQQTHPARPSKRPRSVSAEPVRAHAASADQR
jgi:hypothetical protein